MVALGVMAGGAEDAAVLQPLADSRRRTLNGFIFCVERGIAAGELAADVQPAVLATVFDSFLLGVSTLARDGVSHQALDDAVTRLLSVWDAHRPND